MMLDRCSISCVRVCAKEADSKGSLLVEWIWPDRFPEGPIVKGHGMVLEYLFMVSQSNLNALEQSWLHNSQWCVASQVCSCGWENRNPLKDISPWPS